MTGEFLAQRASNAENVSIWCHHGLHFFRRRKRAETCLVVQTWHRPPQWPPRPRRDLDPHPSSRVRTALPRQGSRTSLYIILRRSINHLMQCWLNRLLRKWYWEFLYSFRIRFSTYVLNSSAEKIQMFLHFVSFSNFDQTQAVEICPQGRQEPVCNTWSVSWLLMVWRRKEPGHQQPWYWPCLLTVFHCPHGKGW